MQVLPFSQASCPQITVISAGLHSCFVTAIMRKYCFRVREISKVRKKECAIQLLYPQHALYMPLYLTPNAIKKKKKSSSLSQNPDNHKLYKRKSPNHYLHCTEKQSLKAKANVLRKPIFFLCVVVLFHSLNNWFSLNPIQIPARQLFFCYCLRVVTGLARGTDMTVPMSKALQISRE